MTQLFLRFYFGVIVILVFAWLVQAYVFRNATVENNIPVIESAFGGGAMLIRDEIMAAGEEGFPDAIRHVQSRYTFPVYVMRRSYVEIDPVIEERLNRGEAVFRNGLIDVAIPDTDWLVELGPLPRFEGPTQTDILVGFGSVSLATALAIAILLRPLARQLRSVERTALAIARGNFGARIHGKGRARGIPIGDAFNKMAERVEALMKTQKELLQAVSHELRTPLARIKFATELVRSADDDETRMPRVDSIDEATDQLDELVGELIDYTRLDYGADKAKHEDIALGGLIADSIRVHSPLHPNVKFSTKEDPESIVIRSYQSGLTRVIGNLVSNAGKYAHSEVRILVSQADDHVTLQVDDDGPGIPEEEREAAFEPFRRLCEDTKPGSGLGLALVRRICRRLGGEVTAGESPLGGARFEMTLPIENAD